MAGGGGSEAQKTSWRQQRASCEVWMEVDPVWVWREGGGGGQVRGRDSKLASANGIL